MKNTNNYLFKTLLSSTSERRGAAPGPIGERTALPTISAQAWNLIRRPTIKEGGPKAARILPKLGVPTSQRPIDQVFDDRPLLP